MRGHTNEDEIAKNVLFMRVYRCFKLLLQLFDNNTVVEPECKEVVA